MISSRRKQAKPQRLPEEDDDVIKGATPDAGLSLFLGSSPTSPPPMDLSTKRSGLLSSPSLEKQPAAAASTALHHMLAAIDPAAARQLLQQMFSQLGGQLPPSIDVTASDPDTTTTVTNAADLPVTPAATPSTDRQHVCAAATCGKAFPSIGTLCWHVQAEHGDEALLECEPCGARFGSREQYSSHRCPGTSSSFSRPASVAAGSSDGVSNRLGGEENNNEEQRRSVPVTTRNEFRVLLQGDEDAHSSGSPLDDQMEDGAEVEEMMHDEEEGPKRGFSLLSQLFPHKQGHSSLPMDLSTATPAELLSSQLPIPPHAFGSTMHGPPSFMMRSPFGGQHGSETFLTPSGPIRSDVLNNEDDWESLMEVSTTDEAEKIRQLVGDKPVPTTDPNQCILCRRVLSCKSALQMHYRTHTGERPFKCKICQRAFTTKGNLKTHMGVHRAKHPYRPMGPGAGSMPSHSPTSGHLPQQQCPICQKRFLTVPQLQSHIAEHTQQLHRLNGVAPEMKDMTRPSLPGFPAGLPFLPFLTAAAQNGHAQHNAPFNLAQLLSAHNQHKMPGLPIEMEPTVSPSSKTPDDRSTAISSFESLLKPDSAAVTSISPGASSDGSGGLHDQTDGSSISHNSDTEEAKAHSHSVGSQSSATVPVTATATVKDEIVQPVDVSENKDGGENPLDAMKKMWAETEPPTPRPMPPLSKHQCAVCYKHFSSSSALQIHMRTHTGDKPFKCDVCTRAFTTRGNLKVHMGTHMWQQSPSRRGRRIFEPGFETSPNQLPLPTAALALPPQLAAQLGSQLSAMSGGLLPSPGAPNPMEMLMMTMNAWRTTCVVCQKVCGNQQELMDHLKEHNNNGTSTEVKAETAA